MIDFFYQANGLRLIDAKLHPFGIAVKSCRSVNNRIGNMSRAITSYLILVVDFDPRRRSMNF